LLLAILAQAAAEPQSPFGSFGFLIPLIPFVFIFYFIVLRPQSKQAAALKSFVDKVAKNDEVVVSNGMLGKVDKVVGDVVFVELANNLKVRVLKSAITQPPAYKASDEKAVVAEEKK
jgi:preprotein translocase subunit YajC